MFYRAAKLLLFFGFHVLHCEIFHIFLMEICILGLDDQIFEGEIAKMVLVFLLLHIEKDIAVEGDISHGDMIAV